MNEWARQPITYMPIIVIECVISSQYEGQTANSDKENELEEVAVVVGADALVDPDAVVVHVQLEK